MVRKVEIYTGAYTSGKSEISINRAFDLAKQGKITLVDLDTVEPAYTLRPIKKELEELGLSVITQENSFGLGETGNVITSTQLNCLSFQGNIVIDVGYGAGGLDILEIVTGINQEKNLAIYIVINTSKPETSTVENIIEYINWSKGIEPREWKKFSGIVSNTHFGDFTVLEDVIKGYETTKKAAQKAELPIISIGMSEEIAKEFGKLEYDNTPIWTLKRFMPKAFW
ncbi:MAG: hypothetical protein PHV68_04630 [Candidatus Gastranaerophilales bacterium]|nr:hypothetical protein [Candidatus Gastranaerophilales bacterium]